MPQSRKQRPCANECGNMVDVRRARLGVVGKQNFELCEWCNEANLPSFRPRAPQYETAELEASNASYAPAGPRVRRWV